MPLAILLDLDGVLWHSVNAHRQAFEKAFREIEVPWTYTQRTFSPYSGMTTENALRQILRDRKVYWNAKKQKDFSRRKRGWAMRYLATRAGIEPGLLRVLRRLRRNHRMAIVSSGHPKSVELFLKRSKTRRFFEVILSSGNVPASKPSPRVYRTALRKLRLKGHEAIAVEDTPAGIRSAKANGIRVIGMRGTCPPGLLRRAGAFRLISRLSELPV